MVNINTFYFENKLNEKLVSDILTNNSYLLPWWVETLDVVFINSNESGDDRGDCPARIIILPEYRKIAIKISPLFLTLDEKEQIRVVQHELIHCITSPYTKFVEEILDSIESDNKSVVQFMKNKNTELCEGLTQDIRIMLETVNNINCINANQIHKKK